MRKFEGISEVATFLESFENANQKSLLEEEFIDWNAWAILRKKIYFIGKRSISQEASTEIFHKRGKLSQRIFQIRALLFFLLQLLINVLKNRKALIVINKPVNMLEVNENNKKIDVFLNGFLQAKSIYKRVYISRGTFESSKNFLFPPSLFIDEALTFFTCLMRIRPIDEANKLAFRFSESINKHAKLQDYSFSIQSEHIQKILIDFFLTEKFYSVLFKCLKPRAIIIQDNVGGPITAAANRINISVYEVQHGFFLANKPDYYIPNYFNEIRRKIPIPKGILTFGEFFSDIILDSGFWNNADIIPIGSYKIDKYRLEVAKTKLSQDKSVVYIVFILQPSCLHQWKKILLEIFDQNLTNLHFYLKPHPAELKKSCQWYANYAKEHSTHFTYLSDKTDLMKILKEADMAAGFHSTALFEAVALGKPVIGLSLDREGFTLNELTKHDLRPYFFFAKDGSDFLETVSRIRSGSETKELHTFGNQIAKKGYFINVEAFINSL